MCHIRRFDCHMFGQQQLLAVRYYMLFWGQLTAQHVGALCRKSFRNSFPTGKFWPYWKKWLCWQIFRLSRCSTAQADQTLIPKRLQRIPGQMPCIFSLSLYTNCSYRAQQLCQSIKLVHGFNGERKLLEKVQPLAAFSAAFFPFVSAMDKVSFEKFLDASWFLAAPAKSCRIFWHEKSRSVSGESVRMCLSSIVTALSRDIHGYSSYSSESESCMITTLQLIRCNSYDHPSDIVEWWVVHLFFQS